MKKTIIFIVFMAVSLEVAADKFYIEEFAIATGQTVVMELRLENELSYTAFQADLYLPLGLSVNPEANQYGFALTDRRDDHALSVSLLPDGGYRLLSYSVSLGAYQGNTGVLMTVPVSANDNIETPASIQIKNVLFTQVTGEEIRLDDQSCMVTVMPAVLLGDADDNGKVDIADLTSIIDYLLGADVEPFNFTNADVNVDGLVRIDDVTELIDLLLARKPA